MSGTPRTDERTYPADCLGKTLVVNSEWARELERENAALREDKELLDANTIWLTVDGQPIWFDGCDLRKAIRRAMEEKQ